MDAKEFLKTAKRICKKYDSCYDCPLDGSDCNLSNCSTIDKTVDIVEEWVKNHPIETHQSRLLKIFPNVPLNSDGIISLCPKIVEGDNFICSVSTCDGCTQKYWLEEIEE